MCHIIGVAMVTSKYFDSGLAFLGSWFHGLSYDTKLSMPLGVQPEIRLFLYLADGL